MHVFMHSFAECSIGCGTQCLLVNTNILAGVPGAPAMVVWQW